jgi:enamine deaminase RidA (YjgF/YER057c/UK114 family)
MQGRIRYNSGSPWEEKIGYSRAIRIGNLVEVSGTVASDEHGNVVGEDDAYLQTKFILEKISKALLQVGASMEDVIRTRLFVTDISKFEDYGKAHQEFFGDIKPASAMYEISGLVKKEFLVEIEVTALVGDQVTVI